MSGWTMLATGLIGLCLGLMAVGLRYLPDRRMFPPVLGIVVTVILWGIGDAITAASEDMRAEQIGIAILYSGSIFQPACWWVLAIRWAEHVGRMPAPILRATWWVPAVWSAGWWLFMLANPWHGRFLTPVIGDRNEYTMAWWVLAITGLSTIAGACALTLWASSRLESPRLRRHGQLIAFSGLMIVVSTCAYVMFGEPFSNTALACLGASAGLLVFGMLRWGLFGLMPLALPVVFEHSPDGLLVVDGEGRLLHVNARARELLAPATLAPDALIPSTLPAGLRTARGLPVSGEESDPTRWWREIGSHDGVLHRLSGPDGTTWLHVSAHEVLKTGGAAPARAVRVRDVTRETLVQADQRRARRLESVTQLAQGVAHDWNNVLSAIRGNADLLRDELSFSPRLRERVEKILRIADRAGELAAQLQLYAGGAEPLRERVDLNELVIETVELLEPDVGPQVGLRLELAEKPIELEADPIQLRQAFLNLLVNAREALSKAGGVVRVSTELEFFDPSTERGLVLGEDVAGGWFASVRIEDTGAGMDPELQERIFEPFFSTKGKQRGTGLATVIGVVRAHAGVVQLESTPGRGTVFTVSLPVPI